MMLIGALGCCVLLIPTVELATATVAQAATPPDVAAQPVAFGNAGFFGSMAGVKLDAPVIGMASTPSGNGYWLVASDGGVFSFGDAGSFGSMGGRTLSAPVVGMASTPSGNGYWLVASDGGVFTFGDAGFHGSAGGLRLSAPIVGMAPTHDGGGYWLVASDGGVFAYGDAAFMGSMGGQRLSQPVVGMAALPDGGGYWLVASDGGVFSFGDAGYFGSMGAVHLDAPVVGMATTSSGNGYWLVGSDGGVFSFGDATFFGSMGAQPLQNPVTAIVGTPDGAGYWLLPTTESAKATLKPGATGAAVLALQQRLSALGYWLGTPDGTFGDSTEQAVWALQKAAGIPRTGTDDPATQDAVAVGTVPTPRSTSGYVIEVDLQDDLVMFVTNGTVEHVLNTSTGGGYTYTEDGVTSVATTPTGHFQIYRQVNGLVVDSLGALWRPKFFDAGFAIHGDSFVPPEPVSHGCARVSNEAIDWIWANNIAPIGTAVWVY
jgi:peptidoglycan hydrolase-like protein with peptidoglycan-binding domain